MAHPVLAATRAIEEALRSVADTNPTFMDVGDKATALRDLARIEARLGELKLRILADARDVAAGSAARDAASWLSHETRTTIEHARGELALARALDRRYAVLAAALRNGHASLAQAKVIAAALDALPAEVPGEILALAEQTLVGYAATFGPHQLRRLAHRILDVVAPEIADEAEARRLAALEASAHRRTRLTMRRCGDGTTRLSALVPDATATRLATYLEAFTNPRKDHGDADATIGNADASTAAERLIRRPYFRKLGEAFCAFLEVVDPSRLPLHAGDATTILITIPLESLRSELGTADLLSGPHVPGHEVTAGQLTAGEVRRLACAADLIPVVLDGDSVPLDLGRSRRLFSQAQRKVLLLRDRTCRAEGCDIPGTWCHAHHWTPWQRGGPTNLHNAALLCAHHHARVHDSAYRAERTSAGEVRFHRRTWSGSRAA